MTQNYYRPGKVNPHLPHDGIELEPEPTDATVAQRDADVLVSQLMVESTKPAGPPRAIDGTWIEPVPVKTDTDPNPEEVDAAAETTAPAADSKAPDAGDTVAVEYRDERAVEQNLRATFPKLSDEALAQQNKGAPGFFDRVPPLYLILALSTVMAFWAPKMLLWTALVALGILITLAVVVKVPGVSHLSHWIWLKYVRRSPGQAERVRKWADNAALSFEHLLDRLPGSLADKLSLPDFSQPVSRKR